MNTPELILQKPKNSWKKPTFRGLVRGLKIGESLDIPTELSARNSAYYNAKSTCPEWTFSVKKQMDGGFKLFRIA